MGSIGLITMGVDYIDRLTLPHHEAAPVRRLDLRALQVAQVEQVAADEDGILA